MNGIRLAFILLIGVVSVGADECNAPNIICPPNLPVGESGESYSYQFQTNTTDITIWQIGDGTLPPGMTLSASGLYSGTPTSAGTYSFLIQAVAPAYTIQKQVFHEIWPGTQNLDVLLLIFAPRNPANPGQTIYTAYNYHDPDLMAAETEAQLESASKGYLNINIVDRIEVDAFPKQRDGFQYTWATYQDSNKDGLADNDLTDSWISYYDMLVEHGLPARIDSGEIDAIWLATPRDTNYYETAMGGKGSFWINGGMTTEAQNLTQRRYVVTAFNVTHFLGLSEANGTSLHNDGHRTDYTMRRVYGYPDPTAGWRGMYDSENRETPWEYFTAIDMDHPGEAGAGNPHFPPNGTYNYDYGNQAIVASTAADWKNNYPNLTGTVKIVNAGNWAGGDKGFLHWWFDHLPSAAGMRTDDVRRGAGNVLVPFTSSNNWWRYIFDLNNRSLWAQSDSEYSDGTGCFYDDATGTAY